MPAEYPQDGHRAGIGRDDMAMGVVPHLKYRTQRSRPAVAGSDSDPCRYLERLAQRIAAGNLKSAMLSSSWTPALLMSIDVDR